MGCPCTTFGPQAATSGAPMATPMALCPCLECSMTLPGITDPPCCKSRFLAEVPAIVTPVGCVCIGLCSSMHGREKCLVLPHCNTALCRCLVPLLTTHKTQLCHQPLHQSNSDITAQNAKLVDDRWLEVAHHSIHPLVWQVCGSRGWEAKGSLCCVPRAMAQRHLRVVRPAQEPRQRRGDQALRALLLQLAMNIACLSSRCMTQSAEYSF